MKRFLFILFCLSPFVSAHADDQKAVVVVEGMSCASCATSIEREFKKHGEVKDIDISISKGEVELTFDKERPMTRAQIEQTVKAAGYSIKGMHGI